MRALTIFKPSTSGLAGEMESAGTVAHDRDLKSGNAGIKPGYSSMGLGIKSPVACEPL